MADIPADFRQIVETHRKMAGGIKERALHVHKMIAEVDGSGKEMAKMDKTLLSMKDKYGKIEEKERKDKEKLEAKMEVERKKQREKH
jgi:hypothetical protein